MFGYEKQTRRRKLSQESFINPAPEGPFADLGYAIIAQAVRDWKRFKKLDHDLYEKYMCSYNNKKECYEFFHSEYCELLAGGADVPAVLKKAGILK